MKKLILAAAALHIGCTLHAQVNLSSDLIICMPISGNANDLSGNGNNGILMGSPALVPNRFGSPNSAYLFNGSTDFIKVISSASLDKIEGNSELTISAWCYIRNWYQGWNVFSIFDRYNISDDMGWDYTIQAPVGCPEQLFIPNLPAFPTLCYYNSPGSTSFGTWTHYAITYSKLNGTFVAYKNGWPITTVPVAGLDLENTNKGDAFIGYSPTGPNEFSDGAIDEVMVYNRALNATEILALYYGYNCENRYDGQPLEKNAIATGVNEAKQNANLVSLFPNPAVNNLNLSVHIENEKGLDIVLKSYDGKILLTKTVASNAGLTHTIDVSGLPKGIYLVNIFNGEASQNLKFVKE
jgi:hypothetical protein